MHKEGKFTLFTIFEASVHSWLALLLWSYVDATLGCVWSNDPIDHVVKM